MAITPTSLPTTIVGGTTTGHAANHQTAHAAINALTADTGWRNLAALVINGWTINSGGHFRVRRVGDEVTWRIRGLNGSAATSLRILDMPQGFGASTLSTIGPFINTSGAWVLSLSVDTAAGSSVGCETYGTAASVFRGSASQEATYRTSVAWPSTLPGAAV